MAKNRGWWSLEIEGNTPDELSDCDREHIAEAIIQGFTGGEIVVDEEEEEEEEEDSKDLKILERSHTMTESQKLVADLMIHNACQFNNYNGVQVVNWLEANEGKWVAFVWTRDYHPLIILRDLPMDNFAADTLFISTETREDAELMCHVAKASWDASEAIVFDKDRCINEVGWYEHEFLVRIWWD